MVGHIPYFREVMWALGSAAVLTFLLHLAHRDWIAALYLATVMTFTIITLVLVARECVAAVIRWLRRHRDDPSSRQEDFGLAG